MSTEKPADGHSITLPGWFIKVMAIAATIFTALFIPWASWLTATLMQVSFKVDQTQAISGRQDKFDERLTETSQRSLLNRLEIEELKRRVNAQDARNP